MNIILRVISSLAIGILSGLILAGIRCGTSLGDCGLAFFAFAPLVAVLSFLALSVINSLLTKRFARGLTRGQLLMAFILGLVVLARLIAPFGDFGYMLLVVLGMLGAFAIWRDRPA